MDKSILSYIWRYSKPQQLVIVALTCLSFPLLYLTLELPKWIINDALSKPTQVHTLMGMDFGPVTFLVILCVLLLVLVVANGALKMRVNTYKGIIGERLVRRLRFQLVDRILKFPLNAFSRVSSGELVSTVTAETEPLAGYIGESVALPLFQSGTMITILLFMFMQDWVFGLVSVALIPVQGYVIPKLQKQVNKLKKERVRRVRKLSERIGETVDGVAEIRLHGTEPYTLSEFSERLGELFYVRMEIFKKKFFMKFLNNTIGQITPFLFYMFGGYLVLQGDLTIGALVAAIGAYKDLTSPWRELLNHYQAHEDSKVKYLQIVEQFSPEGLYEQGSSETLRPSPIETEGGITAEGINFNNDNGETILAGISFSAKPGEMIAITGDYSIRRARLAEILAGLNLPQRGRVLLGGVALDEISNEWFRSRVGLQVANPHMFSGSISDNIVYGLNHALPTDDVETMSLEQRQESVAAGNSEYSFHSDWKDYQSVGVKDQKELVDWYMELAHAIGSTPIMYSRSMLEVFDSSVRPDLASKLLQARRLIRRRLVEGNLEHLVSRFDPDTYNSYASVGENIVLGVIDKEKLLSHRVAANRHIEDVLKGVGINQQALESGLVVATRLVDLYRDIGSSAGLLSEFDLEDDDDIEFVTELVESGKSIDEMNIIEKNRLRSLFHCVIPSRHKFVSIDSRLTTKLVQARRDFTDNMPIELAHLVDPYVEDEYHSRLTVKDNLLFGRMAQHDPESERVIDGLISDCIDEVGVRTELMLLLAESQVGISGSRLPVIARHRIALGRALIKKPKVLIFHDALAPFDEATRKRLRDNIRKLIPGITIIWLDRDVVDPEEFDQVLRFSAAGPLQLVHGEVAPQTENSTTDVDAMATACDNLDETDPFAIVSCSPVFSGLTSSQQRFISDHSRTVNMPADTTIYHSGDEADSVYLIISGEIVTKRKNGTILGELGRMEVFGLLETMAGRPRLLTAHTETDVVLLRVEADAIHDIADDDSKVLRKLLQSITAQFVGEPDNDDDNRDVA